MNKDYNSKKWFYKNPTTRKNMYNPSWYNDIEKQYLDVLKRKNEAEQEIYEIRLQLINLIKENKVDGIQTKNTNVRLIKGYQGRRIDSGRLKKDYPEIFKDYSNPYKMNEHIEIHVKKD